MQFQYDEREGTFYFFLISIYALVLIPLTYYFWSAFDSKDNSENFKKKCHCEPCQSKRFQLKLNSPWRIRRQKILKMILITLWILFFYCGFKVSQLKIELVGQFDPFAELGIDRDASLAEIRRAYRQLSLKHHPDKGGDQKRFIAIAKAFAALTNEESKKNWIEHGNPDGPEATKFGIALPKWIVDKQNSLYVLGAYIILFMVILPITVGTWWYRRIRFDDNVLRLTSNLYYRLLSSSPIIAVKRALMILGASCEFEKSHNSEIVERPSDNEELTSLIRQLSHFNITIREKPFCAVYATRARALLYAHLSRVHLPPNTLSLDKKVILKKCPCLINEMINVVPQIIATISYHKVSRASLPRIDTIENIMKLSPMLMQGLWDNQSPLLQLPHIHEDMLRYFNTKRRNVRTLLQLAELSEEDRRSLLRSLSDEQYRDLLIVLTGMPQIKMDCFCSVVDEEDSTITADSVVTVSVRLYRRDLGQVFPKLLDILKSGGSSGLDVCTPVISNLVEDTVNLNVSQVLPQYCNGDSTLPTYSVSTSINSMNAIGLCPVVTENQEEEKLKKSKITPVWEKNRKKKFSKAKKSRTTAKKPPIKKDTTATQSNENDDDKEQMSDEDSESESAAVDSNLNNQEEDVNSPNSNHFSDDEEDWHEFKRQMDKENSLNTRRKCSHIVHCPLFPNEVYESWWIYIADRKTKMLITPPVQVISLENFEEVQLKFCPNSKPGQYVYTVCLRSSNYFDMDTLQNLKVNVSAAKKVDADHPQWRISDEEDEDKQSQDFESDESQDSDLRNGNVKTNNDDHSTSTEYEYE